MARKITLNVSFDQEQLCHISYISGGLGISKGQFVRDAVDAYIKDYIRQEKQYQREELKQFVESGIKK